MPAILRVVENQLFTEKPEDRKDLGRKSDEVYGRAHQKYITRDAVEALVKSARQNRNGLRDALMISMAFHHGLRAIELVSLRWSDVNFKANDIAINRRKNGRSNRQPLDPADQRNLKVLNRDRRSDEWIFTSERGTRMATDSFASQLAAAADRIGMANVHPHALRHACGDVLAVKGRETRLLGEWLGHRNLQNTALMLDPYNGHAPRPWPIPTPVALNIVRVLRRRFEARIPKPHEPMMVPQR
jgi:integrase